MSVCVCVCVCACIHSCDHIKGVVAVRKNEEGLNKLALHVYIIMEIMIFKRYTQEHTNTATKWQRGKYNGVSATKTIQIFKRVTL